MTCGGSKVIETAAPRGGTMPTRCPGCPECAPPAAEVARQARARARHEEVMREDPQKVEAHLVQPGDALQDADGEWHPVLTAFGENAASASPTTWAIYYFVEGEPTRRGSFNPGAEVTIRRKASA